MTTNVLEYLLRSAAAYPERTAVADGARSICYRQLHSQSAAMGAALHRHLGVQGRPVAVCIRHNVGDVVAFLAVLFSGNFYVPFDMALPFERLERMADLLCPAAVIDPTDAASARLFPHTPIFAPEALLAENAPEADVWREGRDTDPLYVMFTSGSTGEPKGVTISHRSVIDMVEQFCAVFGFPSGTVFGNQAPFDFDVSVKDIYLSLRLGGTVEILEKKLFSFPKLLIERLDERRVDTLIWAVPALRLLGALGALDEARPRHLQNILFSGEVLPAEALRYWMEKFPHCRFVNLYGPTEITCNCTYYILPPHPAPDGAIPIGRAFPNCSVFLLDGDTPVTAEGAVGEICVCGGCLALGYYNRPALTAEAFVQNPLVTAYPERMYRTGDLAAYRGGELVFMGRRDSQIKHMGHRIELAEIALCANAAGGVAQSVCVYDEPAQRLHLFYQGTADPAALSAHLREHLPRYMLPATLHPVATLPQTRTGKVDAKALRALLKGDETT